MSNSFFNIVFRYRLKEIVEKYSGRFPRGCKKRKCNNDDKHGHGQEKKKPSTLC